MLKLQKRQNAKMYLLTGKPEANLSLGDEFVFLFCPRILSDFKV